MSKPYLNMTSNFENVASGRPNPYKDYKSVNDIAYNARMATTSAQEKPGNNTVSNNNSGGNAGVKAFLDSGGYSNRGASGPGVGGIGAFKPSEAYNQAMAYTNQLLSQLSSGRTSYTDKVNAMMDQIANRDKFSYDPDTDPLFQQYLQNSMESGKKAMNDTIGQASALTGGYGSTYATAAANGAYNNYVEDAYDNLTDYYNAALNTYESETQDLYNKLGMYNTADQTEYDRLATAYSANLSNADRMYNQEYSNYWDTANYNQKAAIENANLAYKYAALNQDQANYEKELALKKSQSNASNGSNAEPDGKELSYSEKNTLRSQLSDIYKDRGIEAAQSYLGRIENGNLSTSTIEEMMSYLDWLNESKRGAFDNSFSLGWNGTAGGR